MRAQDGPRALPQDVKKAIAWEAGERLLVVAVDSEGRFVVATDRDLLLQRYPPEYSRIGWDAIDKATFDDSTLRLSIHSETGDIASMRVPIALPGRLPEVVRERVTASIVVSEHVALPGGGGVRVTARRRPDREELSWWGALDEELEPADDHLRAEAARAVSLVRDTMGLDV